MIKKLLNIHSLYYGIQPIHKVFFVMKDLNPKLIYLLKIIWCKV